MARHRPTGARPLLHLAATGLAALMAVASVPLVDAVAGDDLSQWVVAESVVESGNGFHLETAVDRDPFLAATPGGRPGSQQDDDGVERLVDNSEQALAEQTAQSLAGQREVTVGPSTNSTSNAPSETTTTRAEPQPASLSASTTSATQASTVVTPASSGEEPVVPTPTTARSATSSRSSLAPDVSQTSSTAETTMPNHDGSSMPTNVDVAALAALRNTSPLFDRFHSVPSDQLSLAALTEPVARPDNGTVGDGQFRAACQYSHFAYDDPIVFPGQPGRSHLHMFFGNTDTDAYTTADRLINSGGGTCNGFELNRSAYWVPALLDDGGNAVVPEKIILYYKTKFPDRVQRLPQGLKMISGSTSGQFTATHDLFWSCGRSGHAYNKTNRIPDCGGDIINASVVFPECWDGRNLDSADHRSHMMAVRPEQVCPASHPVRLPQISILLYFPGQTSIEGWHLSADTHGGHSQGPPGGTLHADWFGGWNDDAVRLWSDGCMVRARNCSFGQTGTDRALASLNPLQNYPGPYVFDLP